MIRSSAGYPLSQQETREFAPFLPTVAAVCLTGMLVVGQLYVVIPLLPGMATTWGIEPDAAAATATVFGIGYALGFLFWGPLSDTLGRRRLVVAGLVANALLAWLVGMSPTLFAACCLRLVQGFAAATYAPPIYGHLGARLEPRVRVIALTCLTSAFLASGVISQMASQALFDRFGWEGAFAASSIALGIAAVALFWILGKDEDRAKVRPIEAFAAMGGLLLRPRMVALFLGTMTILSSFMAIYAGLQLSGPEAVAGDPSALLWLRASAVPAMVATPLLVSRLRQVPVAMRVGCAMLVAAAAAGWIGVMEPGVLGLGIVLFVFVGALALASPGLIESINARSGSARGGGVALYTFSLFVGASVGPQMAVALRQRGFGGIAFTVAGVLVGGALLVALSREVIPTRS